MIYAIAVLAPLVGALISGLLGRAIGDRASEAVSILVMIVAAVCGVASFIGFVWGGAPDGVISLGTWLEAGTFHVSWALRYDTLSVLMVGMVTFVSCFIHIYSIGYMSHDEYPRYRFFSYLNLFTFAMLMLVTADNLLQLFFGWEG
ncbi:MAG: NADH-quinone oxidoreductase subunit L, partial [Acetobacteraceae bacterium]|nr:NADH-quinone oxidoreductase subunit L [Acetobacteraceae bacterium]